MMGYYSVADIVANTVSPEDALAEIAGQCPVCGAAFAWESRWGSAQAIVDELLRIEEINPVLSTALRKLTYSCNIHLEQSEQYRRRMMHQQRVVALIRETLRLGLYAQDALDCSFESSAVAFEKRNEDVWVRARAWGKQAQTNWWIEGLPGCGKTYLARCMATRALQDGLSVAELNAIRMTEPAFTRPPFGAQDPMRPYREAHVLVLNDPHVVPWDETSFALWYSLMDARYSTKRCTIITSNMSLRPRTNRADGMSEFVEHVRRRVYNHTAIDAILTRLSWPGARCEFVRLEGDNLRTKQVEQ